VLACRPTAPSSNEITLATHGMRDGAAASGQRARPAVDRVDLGRARDQDGTISDRTRSFEATDTIHAAVRVTGDANSGILRLVWSDARGTIVHDETRIVTPSRDETVTFEAAQPRGWRGGEHQLDVFLDGRLASTQRFRVAGGDQGLGPQQGIRAPAPH
jgi:hypothetical protein